MNFIRHYELEGKHAPFPASQPYWLGYDPVKAVTVYRNRQAKEQGTRLHEWAAETIRLKIRQRGNKSYLSAYINDAIGFGMKPEVVLYYSDLFFGTADAISFEENVLRIHDLKTGVTPVHIEQLVVYAALFCLEYKIKPRVIKAIELRIYQNGVEEMPLIYRAPSEQVDAAMKQIVELDKAIRASM